MIRSGWLNSVNRRLLLDFLCAVAIAFSNGLNFGKGRLHLVLLCYILASPPTRDHGRCSKGKGFRQDLIRGNQDE